MNEISGNANNQISLTNITKEGSVSSDDEILPTENLDKASRGDRLKLRQNFMEVTKINTDHIKYKPSPQKKIPKDTRGQWRRIYKTRDEQQSWKLFDSKDVDSHQHLPSLLQMVKTKDVTQNFIDSDAYESYSRAVSGIERVRIYDRVSKQAVFHPKDTSESREHSSDDSVRSREDALSSDSKPEKTVESDEDLTGIRDKVL